MKQNFAPFLVLLAAVLWGTTGTAQALAPDGVHPIAIGATRLAVGGLFLLTIILLTGKLQLKHWPLKRTFFAALSMAAYQPFFFTAVMMTGVAVGTVVAIGSAPILSGFIEWIFFKKRPQTIWWASTILSIIGCTLLFTNKESVYTDPFGIVMALGAGLAFASYTIISRDLVDYYSSLSVVAIVFTLSALLLVPFLFIFDMSWIMQTKGLIVSLHLGIVATGIAYLLFASGLKFVPSSTAVTLALAEPLTATLLGVFIVGETLNVISFIGILLLLIGLSMLIFSARVKRMIKRV
ncbi:MAG TPA: EamA family transporter [Bacillota bacterium]|nr:EamA family transporter [Bacillota bacterium]